MPIERPRFLEKELQLSSYFLQTSVGPVVITDFDSPYKFTDYGDEF